MRCGFLISVGDPRAAAELAAEAEAAGWDGVFSWDGIAIGEGDRVVGAWPKERSVRRALRYDGIVPQTADPSAIRELTAFIARERFATAGPIDIIVEGTTRDADDTSAARALAGAGATWWIEPDWTGATVDSLRQRVAAGPPRIGDQRSR